MRGLGQIAISSYVFAVLSLPTFAEAGVDSTASLQLAIDQLPEGGVLDCAGGHYIVSSLRLKQDMTLQNCDFETLPGSNEFSAPITLDGRNHPLSGITLRNVNVDGNRHLQTAIGLSGQEDGGRHCFRLLGRVSNVVIENSSGSYCAGDGLALVSWGASQSDLPADLPFQNILVRNSSFVANRRHGVSGDGLHSITFENVLFSGNGSTVAGGLEGDHCATDNGKCYGTGFWYEDYQPAGEGLNDLVFSRCVFRNNFQRSLYFLSKGQPSAPGFQPRSGIQILNSSLDAGSTPLPEDYALQFQVAESAVGKGAVFQQISIQNTLLGGSVGFRQTRDVAVIASTFVTTLPWFGFAAYSTNIAFRDVQPAASKLAASLDPLGRDNPAISYSQSSSNAFAGAAPPSSGASLRGDIVWNSQNVAPTGWVCIASGSPCLQWKSF